jgi:hypothetical protein
MANKQQQQKKGEAMTKQQNQQATAVNDLPEHLRDYVPDAAGTGANFKAGDFMVPMAKVLQALSPEVTKGNQLYFPGAEAGDVFIKNLPNPLIKGTPGFLFQPVRYEEAAIEWLARGKGGGGGGGFVARHPVSYIGSVNSEEVPNPMDVSKTIWVRKGTTNPLIHTRYYSGFLIQEGENIPEAIVIPFSGSGHSVAKAWNGTMDRQRLSPSHVAPPRMWFAYYRITTKLRQRADQSWYVFEVANANPKGKPMWAPSQADLDRGEALFKSLSEERHQIDFAGSAEPALIDNDKM